MQNRVAAALDEEADYNYSLAPPHWQHWKEGAYWCKGSVMIDTAIFLGNKKKKHIKQKTLERWCSSIGPRVKSALHRPTLKIGFWIDCLNIFSGTKLIIPPDWDIQSKVVTEVAWTNGHRLQGRSTSRWSYQWYHLPPFGHKSGLVGLLIMGNGQNCHIPRALRNA